MSKSFTFVVENQEIKKDLNFDQLSRLPSKIRDLLFQKEKYTIESDINTQIFNEFFDNFLGNTKNMTINADNAFQYHLLSEEFNFSIEDLENDEYDKIFKLSALLNIQNSKNCNHASLENYISQNLDFYLNNYANKMYKIPIPSLYNIFYNKSRVLNDQEKSYQFIVSNNNPNLFVLIESLDGTKLSESTLEASISKQDEHFGFIPYNSHCLIGTLQKEVESLQKEKDKLKKQVAEHELTISKLNQQIPFHITKVGRTFLPWEPIDILFIIDGLNEKILKKSLDTVYDIIFDTSLNYRGKNRLKLINNGFVVDLNLTSNPKIYQFTNDVNYIEKIYEDLEIKIGDDDDDEEAADNKNDDDEECFNAARSIATNAYYAKLLKCAISNFDWRENSSKFIYFTSSSCSIDSDELKKCVNELAENNYYLQCFYFNENAKKEFIKMKEVYASNPGFCDICDIADEKLYHILCRLSTITYLHRTKDDTSQDLYLDE